jgi:hypothetical protein
MLAHTIATFHARQEARRWVKEKGIKLYRFVEILDTDIIVVKYVPIERALEVRDG